ncbi:MAG TPA: hypothetical protein VK601_24440 [Kofleriaceae bacterium]|nr:hypothetical protein [Kofleriaceae bacterium]
MLNLCLATLCITAVTRLAGCAAPAPDDVADPELTTDEAAALPDAGDADHVGLDAVLAAEPPETDAATFDTDEAAELVDVAVDDTDEAAAATGFQAHAAILKFGLHPRASDALRSIGVSASRIMQTIGNAAASAGTHAQDGVVNGHPYSAATDISVSGLSNTQIKNLLARLAKVGFAAWFRWPGHDGWPSSEVRHIHAVYANAKMKSSLRSQVRSWLVGRNGLVSNTLYGFFHWTAAEKAVVRNKFAQSGQGTTNAGATCFVGGLYCGGDKISGDKNTLYRCTGTGAPAVVRHCASGCAIHPGDDDACR